MGNVTVTPRNTTNSTNYSIPVIRKKGPSIPPFRGPQTLQAVQTQAAFLLFLVAAAVAINIIMIILLQKRFKSLPYIMLQNIAIVDMLTVVMAGPLFLVGVLLDQFGLILQTICNVQGFFLSSLCAVFLNTVSLVAISRCLAVLKPSLYHKIFVNKIIIRLLLLGIWSSSALLSTPPMNYKEGWGAYRRLESTCWLAWLPDQKSAMAYNVIVTMVTLGVAITFSALATKVVFSAGSKVIPSEPVMSSIVGTS
ncbi:probable G-protein coupled receptor 101 [Exaiptasia diaphana]|uniref:G-protein coupled receptors family 1 profile domain-containing protein n=1 Tax=Exaiptasia diaphana TaxID=2652724 RepID=A0A913WPW6_EXADI|nr:probable G-protein coupled receptor 101 [Exaiptasia diaphana]KXJ18968.1 Blue-sensitive opsin [Exaiptasia diaphana]